MPTYLAQSQANACPGFRLNLETGDILGHKFNHIKVFMNHKRPEWLRLPKTGQRCPFTGLSRSSLNELILATKENEGKPPVASKCLRKRGSNRGIRLINYDSLMAFIARHDEAREIQNGEETL